ncbi:MAG: DnaJ domain-containing protein [Deltaproteobacteria bacterium]|nr:DnaJ domain-containing protein [Deltaproteobacteria bacterium]
MSTTPEPEFAYEVGAGVDITKLPLTPEEGVVVSRILGRRVTADDLVKESVVPQARAASVLESLVRKGAVLRVGAGRPGGHAAGPDPYKGIVFSMVDLSEPADLTEDQRKRILFFDMNLESWSHYKLLGSKRTATPAEVKVAYFKSSKEFHPDAFFRKNLGSFRERLDRIFRAMKTAYDTLQDPQKRAKYDETAIIELTPEEEAELERLAADKRKADDAKRRDERNADRMKDQRLKRNPMAERIKKARDYLRMAEDAQRAGKLDEAANHARLAVGYDESIKGKADAIVLVAERARAATMMKRIQQIIASPSDMRDLADELNRVADEVAEVAARANDGPLLCEVSSVLMKLKRPVRAAKLAQQAADVDSRNPRAWEALAEAAHADSKWAILLRASDRWLQLEPGNARAKELHKVGKRQT